MKYAEIDLHREFIRYQERNGWGINRDRFVAYLRDRVTNPQVVTERLRWCDNCGSPHDLNMVDDFEQPYCPSCWAEHRTCDHCGTRTLAYTRVLAGGQVCRACLDAHYVNCRNCNGAYPHGEARNHLHGADGCCESPAQEFTVPHHGGGSIRQDEQVRVEFDAGLIATRTIHHVVTYLADRAGYLGNVYETGSRASKMYNLALALERNRDLVGLEEKTKDGTFVTRLKRYAYKEYSLKLDPEILTGIGNLVSTTTAGRAFSIAFTRDLNLPPAEFGNNGSCWWTDYKESRCALKSNGGMAMRDLEGERVKGRAWVMPLKVGVDGGLAPTFDAHSGIYFAFNGYGTLQADYHRVLMEVVGAEHYVGISFEAERYYVNSGTGKLIGPADIIKPWEKKVLAIPLTAHSDLFEVESTFGSAETTKKEKVHV